MVSLSETMIICAPGLRLNACHKLTPTCILKCFAELLQNKAYNINYFTSDQTTIHRTKRIDNQLITVNNGRGQLSSE